MNPRLVTALGGLLAVSLILYLVLSGGSEVASGQTPNLPTALKEDRNAAPKPANQLVRDLAKKSLGEYQEITFLEVVQPNGASVMISREEIPVYDLRTGEVRATFEMSATRARPKKGDEADFKRRTVIQKHSLKDLKPVPGRRSPNAGASPGRRWGNWRKNLPEDG